MIDIARIQAWAFRSPTQKPVATSFGVMHDRPAVLVRVEDRDGAFGWGEIWANWPAAGAEHRVRLLEMDVAHLVLGQQVASPTAFFHNWTPRPGSARCNVVKSAPSHRSSPGLILRFGIWQRGMRACRCAA